MSYDSRSPFSLNSDQAVSPYVGFNEYDQVWVTVGNDGSYFTQSTAAHIKLIHTQTVVDSTIQGMCASSSDVTVLSGVVFQQPFQTYSTSGDEQLAAIDNTTSEVLTCNPQRVNFSAFSSVHSRSMIFAVV
jgi:hypothetical protein